MEYTISYIFLQKNCRELQRFVRAAEAKDDVEQFSEEVYE